MQTDVKVDRDPEGDSTKALGRLAARVNCIKSVSSKRESHQLQERLEPAGQGGAATLLLVMKLSTEGGSRWPTIKKWQDKLKNKWSYRQGREGLSNSSSYWLVSRIPRLTCQRGPILKCKIGNLLLSKTISNLNHPGNHR